MKRLFSIVIAGGLLSGCVAPPPLPEPPPPRLDEFSFGYENATYEDKDVSASIKYAKCGRVVSGADIAYGCERYVFRIQNRTDHNFYVDWNHTAFVNGGKTDGGFMLEGTYYLRRTDPKIDSIILDYGSIDEVIWPTSLVSHSYGSSGDREWSHDYITNNPNGINLVLHDEAGVEKRITLLATVTYMTPQSSQSAIPVASAAGKVVLGVSFSDVPPTLAASVGRAQLNGVIIAIMAPGSVAEKAGLKVGDVVMSYGNTAITKKDDLVAAVGATAKGSKVPIHILRDKDEMDVTAAF